MHKFKLIFTNSRTGQPGTVNVRAQSRQHALDIAAVLGCEDALVLFEIKQEVKNERRDLGRAS